MKTKLIAATLMTASMLAASQAADIMFAWDPPNATPLEQIPLLKYNLYFGIDGGSITNFLGTTSNRVYTATNMTPGNYQVVVKAINVWGKESVPSNVLTLPAFTGPGSPSAFKATFRGTFDIEIR